MSRRSSRDGTPDGFVDRTTERARPLQTLGAIVSHGLLIRNLVQRDLKLKYRGSILGFLWSLLNPLAVVIAYTLAFKYILGSTQPGYPFFVLLGVMAWTFFASAATMSTGAIVESAALVKAVRFPRTILPIATVFFNLAQYLLTALVFLPLMLVVRQIPPAWPMTVFPIFLALQVAFTIGIALILAAATAYFRDVRHLTEVALQLLFWTTPIVYPASIVPESLRTAILMSPMSPFIVAYQQIFYDGQWPDLFTWIVAAAYATALLAIGSMVFLWLDDELVEQL